MQDNDPKLAQRQLHPLVEDSSQVTRPQNLWHELICMEFKTSTKDQLIQGQLWRTVDVAKVHT